MNFNDYPSSLVVLFQQLVVNHWWVVVNMLTDICGNTHLVRLFFVVFWVVIVLILMNIMISIVLDLYDSV